MENPIAPNKSKIHYEIPNKDLVSISTISSNDNSFL